MRNALNWVASGIDGQIKLEVQILTILPFHQESQKKKIPPKKVASTHANFQPDATIPKRDRENADWAKKYLREKFPEIGILCEICAGLLNPHFFSFTKSHLNLTLIFFHLNSSTSLPHHDTLKQYFYGFIARKVQTKLPISLKVFWCYFNYRQNT